MALTFWKWQGDQRDTASFSVRTSKRWMIRTLYPEEMVKYVTSQTPLKALVRVGGDVDMLKRLIAAGFPVVIEKGLQQHPKDWMGHYALLNGYDDARQRFISQDSFIMADLPVPYSELDGQWWRDFNYVYLVIYPAEREAEVLALLGPQADVKYNHQFAAQKAQDEISALSGRDLYFAWYNLGSSLVALQDYAGQLPPTIRLLPFTRDPGGRPPLAHALVPDWAVCRLLLHRALRRCDQFRQPDLGPGRETGPGRDFLLAGPGTRRPRATWKRQYYDYKTAVEMSILTSTAASQELLRLGIQLLSTVFLSTVLPSTVYR